MAWFLTLLALAVLAIVVIVILNRFYAKSTRDSAVIRTGAGGRKVVVDGGALALPFLHRIERVSMRSIRLEVSRSGRSALMTIDRLRVDMEIELHVRVASTADAIAIAAQAFGSKLYHDDEIRDLLSGKLIDAVQGEAARRTMDQLHEDRSAFVTAVAMRLSETISNSGLMVESISLVRLDQTPFAAMDDSNAFDAVGMRRLAEVVSANRKARVDVEAEADIAIRRRQLDQIKQRFQIEREQDEAEIVKSFEIEQRRIRADADINTARTRSGFVTEEARIERERDTRRAEIERDLNVRKRELEAATELEQRKIEDAVVITGKRAEEIAEQVKTEAARLKVIEVQEATQTSRELAVADRLRRIAVLRAEESAAVDDVNVQSEISSILARAKAEGEATGIRSDAERNRLVGEAQGKQAQIAAQNTQSDALLQHHLEMHRLDRMPEIAAQMMKPVEKIESIRINQIAGLGSNGGSRDASPFNQALESILGMSVQLPMMKKIGDEIGLDFDASLAGRTAHAAGRAASATSMKSNKS